MSQSKIATLTYFAILLLAIALFVKLSANISGLFDFKELPEGFDKQYGNMQKKAGITGIISFVVLLLFSVYLYYLTTKSTYIILTNIIYIAFTLFVFVSLNRDYFSVQNITYNEKSEYWITVFMGIFYILGAILVSAIAYITVRNYTKRSQHSMN